MMGKPANIDKARVDFGWMITPAAPDSQIDAIDPDDIRDLLESGGMVLFRGFAVGMEQLVGFSDRFSRRSVKHAAPALRPAASRDGTVTEVLVGNHEVDLHGEMHYLPRRPELLWLCCVIPPDTGGQTVLCHGAEFLDALSAGARDRFREHNIMYCHDYPATSWRAFGATTHEAVDFLKQWKDVRNITVTDDDHISFDYVTSAISRSRSGQDVFVNSILNIKQYEYTGLSKVLFEDGSAIPQAILDEIRDVGRRIASPVEWEAGDLLVVENSSVMHGRRPFQGRRKILTRFSLAAQR